MNGKKPLILALVVFNAALLGLLVTLQADRSARAQVVVPEAVNRFVALSEITEENRAVVWVLDSVSRRLIAYFCDPRTGRVEILQQVPLDRLFRYREAPQPTPNGRDVRPGPGK